MHGGMETWEANQPRLGTPRPMNSNAGLSGWMPHFCLGLLVGMVRSQRSPRRDAALSSPSVLGNGVEEVSRPRIDCSDRASSL